MVARNPVPYRRPNSMRSLSHSSTVTCNFNGAHWFQIGRNCLLNDCDARKCLMRVLSLIRSRNGIFIALDYQAAVAFVMVTYLPWIKLFIICLLQFNQNEVLELMEVSDFTLVRLVYLIFPEKPNANANYRLLPVIFHWTAGCSAAFANRIICNEANSWIACNLFRCFRRVCVLFARRFTLFIIFFRFVLNFRTSGNHETRRNSCNAIVFLRKNQEEWGNGKVHWVC